MKLFVEQPLGFSGSANYEAMLHSCLIMGSFPKVREEHNAETKTIIAFFCVAALATQSVNKK